MQHMMRPNLCLSVSRQCQSDWRYVFCAEGLSDVNLIASAGLLGSGYVFPLWLYTENMGKVEKTPNLNPEIVKKIEEALCALSLSASLRENNTSNNPVNPVNPVQKLSPEDIFHYIYAVLHTPQYRSRYREFLKVDFPRIPYPSSAEEFRRLAAIGEKLVQVHLLKAPEVRDMFSPYANFAVSGESRVEGVKWENGRVFINDAQYFDNVPAEAWGFYIGGYQPAQKWLKDRKGRVLSYDDIKHYKAIIAALVETSRLMNELAATSPVFSTSSPLHG